MGNLANPDGEKKEDALPDVSPQAADGGRSVREEKPSAKTGPSGNFWKITVSPSPEKPQRESWIG